MFQIIGMRFLRGFLASAVSMMAVVTFNGDIKDWALNLAVSCLVGGIAGGILAVDKYFRLNPEE